MNYTKVDIDKWSRGSLFQFYIEKMRIVMSLTVDINVAPLITYTKKNGLKFYPAMIWVVSKVINSHDEFKYSWDTDGNLIRWDSISPSYTVFNRDDECFSKFVTEYMDDIFEFYQRTVDDQRKYQEERAIIGNQPQNFFDVSCLPWVKYKHFDVHVFDEGKFLAPVVTWGNMKCKTAMHLCRLL